MLQTNLDIPPIIWSGVIGALVALFGNILANRATAKRQRDQLRHDSTERRREREMSLKREIFLDVADASAQKIQHLFNVAQDGILETQQTGIQGGGLQSFKAVLGRAEIIATVETLKAIHKAEGFFAQSALELLERQITLKVKRDRIDQLARAGDIYLMQMNPAEYIDGKKNPFHPALPHQFEQALNAWNETHAALESERRGLEEEQINLLMETVRRAQAYSDLLTEPMLAIRLELGIETDEAAYRNFGSSSADGSPAQQIEQMMGRVRKLLDDSYEAPGGQVKLPDGR